MSTKEEEPKRTLPAGHPQATYVGPDLTLRDGGGVLPSDAQKEVDEAKKAREDEVKAAVEHEHKVATAEAKEAEKAEKSEKAEQAEAKSR